MNDIQKLTLSRVMKVIFYLLGFPLLLLFVAKDSMILFNEGAFSETAKSGITAVFLIWVAVALVQGGLYLLMRRQRGLRTIIIAVLSVALLLAPVAGMDANLSKKLDKVNDAAKKDFEAEFKDSATPFLGLPEYSLQKQWFNALSDVDGYAWHINKDVHNFIRVYGLQEYYPHLYRSRSHGESDKQDYAASYMMVGDKKISVKGKDADKEFDKQLSKGKSPYLYNENGLLYEGYIFGVQNALEQLIQYNKYLGKTVYRKLSADASIKDAAGKNRADLYTKEGAEYKKVTKPADTDKANYYELIPIDDALKKLVAEQRDATSGPWFDYTQTADYKQYLAEQQQMIITPERLNQVLATLFGYIGQADGLTELVRGLSLGKILEVLPGLIKPTTTDLNAGDIGNLIAQLLYGGSDGKGGETTGLALPGKYLFPAIKLSGTMRKSLYGEFDGTNIVGANGKPNLAPSSTDAGELYVFVLEYKETDDHGPSGALKDDVLKPVLTCEKYKDAITATSDKAAAERRPADFDPQENAEHRNKRYFDDKFYFEEDLGTAYGEYKAALEKPDGKYADIPAVAALVDLLKSLNPAIPLLGGLLNADTVMGLVGGALPGLDLASVLNDVLEPAALDKVVADLMGGLNLSGLKVETVQGLLDGILGEVSFYYHPMMHTCWQEEYIPDTDKELDTADGKKINLSEYAVSKYNCEQFGITGGCVLAVKTGGGLLTGTTLGAGAAATDAYTPDHLYKLKAEIEYAQEAYSLLAARRYMVIWSGIIVISVYMTMYYARKEEQLFLSLTKGGENQ